MGIRRRSQDDPESALATSRWSEAAETVTVRFEQLHNLPLDEAVETALLRTPGSFSRDELARRIAASRDHQHGAEAGTEPGAESGTDLDASPYGIESSP